MSRRLRRKNRRAERRKPKVLRQNKRTRRLRGKPSVIAAPRLSFAERKRRFTRRRSRPAPSPARTTFTSRSGGGSGRPGGFGSGRIQNRFTPGNTFTGYSRGGY